MKKRIVILMLILLVSVPFYGQKKSKFGVYTGATYSKEVGQHLSDVDKKYAIDFMVGISLDYYLTEKLSIKANAVAPVVTTSSMTKICLPSKRSGCSS